MAGVWDLGLLSSRARCPVKERARRSVGKRPLWVADVIGLGQCSPTGFACKQNCVPPSKAPRVLHSITPYGQHARGAHCQRKRRSFRQCPALDTISSTRARLLTSLSSQDIPNSSPWGPNASRCKGQGHAKRPGGWTSAWAVGWVV